MSNVINLDLKKEHSKKTLYWILRYIIKHHKHYGDVGYIQQVGWHYQSF